MAMQILKRNGQIVGWISSTEGVESDKIIYDKMGRTKGYYNSSSNSTYDAKGARVGDGDFLVACLDL